MSTGPTYYLLLIFALVLTIFSQHKTASAVEMFKFKGLGANGSFSSVDGCIQTNVEVCTAETVTQAHPEKRGPFSSVNIFITQYDLCADPQVLAAEGVADLAEPDLRIDTKLNWATLKTTVAVVDSLTGNIFDVTIDLAWAGISSTTREHSNFHFGDKECRIYNRFDGIYTWAILRSVAYALEQC